MPVMQHLAAPQLEILHESKIKNEQMRCCEVLQRSQHMRPPLAADTRGVCVGHPADNANEVQDQRHGRFF